MRVSPRLSEVSDYLSANRSQLVAVSRPFGFCLRFISRQCWPTPSIHVITEGNDHCWWLRTDFCKGGKLIHSSAHIAVCSWKITFTNTYIIPQNYINGNLPNYCQSYIPHLLDNGTQGSSLLH